MPGESRAYVFVVSGALVRSSLAEPLAAGDAFEITEQAARKRMAVDSSNDRLAQACHQREQLDEQIAAPMTLEIGHASVEAVQVGTGAKSSIACAGQNRHPDLGLVPAPSKRCRQVAQHHSGQGIALLGPVERYRGDVAVDRQQHLLERRKFSQRRNRRAETRHASCR
jgi:hypothetical protein